MISSLLSGARQCQFKLFYNSKDITIDVTRYIESFSFTERAKQGESDDLNIVFLNTHGEWSNRWFPQRGDKLRFEIETKNWHLPNDTYSLDCGSFEIDEITDSGPPSTVTISALSVGITSSIRGQANSKAWENFQFSRVINEIAKKHSFGVFFDSQYDPVIDRFDQKNESDLAFIIKVAEYIGVNVRMAKNKIIVYQEALYDEKDVSLTLTKNRDGYKSHSFRAASADIYMACQVQYLDSLSGEMLTYQYTPDGRSGTVGKSNNNIRIDEKTRMIITDTADDEIKAPNVGKVLKINRRCKNLSEAQHLAKSMLRQKNKRELTGSLSFLGNLYLRAGLTLSLSGFGIWDYAKWVIDDVNHSWSVSSGLETSFSIRGALSY